MNERPILQYQGQANPTSGGIRDGLISIYAGIVSLAFSGLVAAEIVHFNMVTSLLFGFFGAVLPIVAIDAARRVRERRWMAWMGVISSAVSLVVAGRFLILLFRNKP